MLKLSVKQGRCMAEFDMTITEACRKLLSFKSSVLVKNVPREMNKIYEKKNKLMVRKNRLGK